MTALTPTLEKEYLARGYAANLAPRLRAAIDRGDVDKITELTTGLGHQELLVLVVLLASEWPTTRCRQMVVCRRCREYDRHEGNGFCRACHGRWVDAGRLESGPPPAIPANVSGLRGAQHLVKDKTDRLQDYADLEAWGADCREAAERLGVSESTVYRYRAALASAPLQMRIPDLRRAS